MTPDIDFKRIAPRGSSQDKAFEEFCCQVAAWRTPTTSSFVRVRGDGGDGGVECFWRSDLGEVTGWQVKYIFDLTSALSKVRGSLTRALAEYPELTEYVVCLPFELSGSRGRGGTSELDRFERFRVKEERKAAALGRRVAIKYAGPTRLTAWFTASDANGGARRYWFGNDTLSDTWFQTRLRDALKTAGPRYRPKMHHGHSLDTVLSALGDTSSWRLAREAWVAAIRDHVPRWTDSLENQLYRKGPEEYPEAGRSVGRQLAAALESIVAQLSTDLGDPAKLASLAVGTLELADAVIQILRDDIDTRFGTGRSRSQQFRQYQASYQVCFPARHLDQAIEIRKSLADFSEYAQSPAHRAQAERRLLLTGEAGIGKTHGICDAAQRRSTEGLKSIVFFGGQLSNTGPAWPQMRASIGLTPDWTLDQFTEALEAASRVHGRIVVFIDALDERLPDRTAWRDQLPGLLDSLTVPSHAPAPLTRPSVSPSTTGSQRPPPVAHLGPLAPGPGWSGGPARSAGPPGVPTR